MSSVVKATAIVSEYGKYYVNEGQNEKRLHRSLLQMPVTLEKYARHIRSKETIYRMANYQFGSVVRPFKPTFNPNSDIEFIPNEIVLRKMKADISITPDEIEESWLGFMSGDTTRNKKDWPIVRWLMEEYVAKQIGVDRELNMVYKGEYDPDGTTPLACIDGVKKLLYKGANNAQYPINVVNGIGALDASSIFDQVEKFDEAIPHIYSNQPICIFMAPSWVRAYKKDKRSQNFLFLDDINAIDESVMFTKHVIVALPSMEGTNDMWATSVDNFLWITKREGGVEKADVQAHDYDIHVMVNWWEGIGFACNKMVWATAETVNDTAEDGDSDGIVTRIINPYAVKSYGIEATKAVCDAMVIGELPDDATVTVEYSENEDMSSSSDSAELTAVDGVYTASLTLLTTGTIYYWRVKVTIGDDNYLSEIKDFTTL